MNGVCQKDHLTTTEEFLLKLTSAGIVLPELEDKDKDKDIAIITHCGSGGRGGKAAALLVKKGYTNVHNGGGPAHVAKAIEMRAGTGNATGIATGNEDQHGESESGVDKGESGANKGEKLADKTEKEEKEGQYKDQKKEKEEKIREDEDEDEKEKKEEKKEEEDSADEGYIAPEVFERYELANEEHTAAMIRLADEDKVLRAEVVGKSKALNGVSEYVNM